MYRKILAAFAVVAMVGAFSVATVNAAPPAPPTPPIEAPKDDPKPPTDPCSDHEALSRREGPGCYWEAPHILTVTKVVVGTATGTGQFVMQVRCANWAGNGNTFSQDLTFNGAGSQSVDTGLYSSTCSVIEVQGSGASRYAISGSPCNFREDNHRPGSFEREQRDRWLPPWERQNCVVTVTNTFDPPATPTTVAPEKPTIVFAQPAVPVQATPRFTG